MIEGGGGPNAHYKYWNTTFVIVGTFFYIVGGTIGEGIMVVPVELAKSGFWSFLLISILPVASEIIAGILFIQIIQKVRRHFTGEGIEEKEEAIEHRYQPVSLDEDSNFSNEETPVNHSNRKNYEIKLDLVLKDEEKVESDEDSSFSKPLVNSHSKTGNGQHENIEGDHNDLSQTFLSDGIDLHTIARCYFNRLYCIFIDIILLNTLFPHIYFIAFCQTIVSFFTNDEYSVADFTQYFSPVTSIFIFTLTFFLGFIIDGFLVSISCLNSSLLCLVVILGLFVLVPFSSTFNLIFISRPYFAETFLITGSVLFIPQMFSKLKPTKRNMKLFTCSFVFGVIFAQLVSSIFCVCVWGLVPQTDEGFDNLNILSNNKVTLERSFENEELANIPFSKMVGLKYPSLWWIGSLVSFVTMASCFVAGIVYTISLKSVLYGIYKEVIEIITQRRYFYQQQHQQQQGNNMIRNIIQLNYRKYRVFNFLGYVVVTLIVTFMCFVFAKEQFVLCEFSGWVTLILYVCFTFVLVMIDCIKSPFSEPSTTGIQNNQNQGIMESGDVNIHAMNLKKNKDRMRIWWEIPRWLYVTLSVLLGVYYIGFCLWYSGYSVLKYGYLFLGKDIPI